MTLESLKKKCEAATPGPWDYYLEQGYEGYGAVITYNEDANGCRSIKDSVFARLSTSEANKRFLAAANPATVLKLIQAIEEMTETLNHYKYTASELQEHSVTKYSEAAVILARVETLLKGVGE